MSKRLKTLYNRGISRGLVGIKDSDSCEELVMSIVRVNHYGYVNFAVIDNTSGVEIVRFDRYTDATDFIMFCDGIVFEEN